MIEAALYILLSGIVFSPNLRDFAVVGVLFLLIRERLSKRRAAPELSVRWQLAVVAFVAVPALAAVVNESPEASLRSLWFYPMGALVFLATRHVVAAGGIVRLERFVLVGLVVLACDVIWQFAFGKSLLRGDTAIAQRFMGSLVHPTNVSLLAILASLGVASWSGQRSDSSLLVAAIVAIAGAVLLSGTRAAGLGLVMCVFATGWITGSRRVAIMLIATALVLSVAAAWWGSMSVTRRLAFLDTDLEHERLGQWQAAAELFAERPLTGHGPHSFRRVCLERRGDAGSMFGRIDCDQAPYPHDIYLEALAGTGLPGLVALITIAALGFAALRGRLANSAHARAAVVSLVIFLSIGLVDMSFVKDWVHVAFWMPLGIAAGLPLNGADFTASVRPGMAARR